MRTALTDGTGCFGGNIVSFRQACVSRSESGFLLGQEAADRGSAYISLAGDLGFAVALLVQF
jgi:hypothetical protein